MYFLTLGLIILLALIAFAWSPVFALIIFAIGFIVFLAMVAMKTRADQKPAPPEQPGRQPQHQNDTPTGIWGERQPS
ncbi:MAG TPA: hypothetical protein VFS26_07670 [Solirubrobacterales bacterium]|nr:hypothetical protein [Solirubrobacterales bacterium]